MGQILHWSVTTTEVVCRAMQNSQVSLRALFGISTTLEEFFRCINYLRNLLICQFHMQRQCQQFAR